MRKERRQAIQPAKRACLVAVHRHSLRVSAEFAILRRADGAAVVADGAALLEGEELLGAEALVVDLGRGLDEVLEMGAREEVAQVDKLAVVLILNWKSVSALISNA
jgi:hypothetical protein